MTSYLRSIVCLPLQLNKLTVRDFPKVNEMLLFCYSSCCLIMMNVVILIIQLDYHLLSSNDNYVFKFSSYSSLCLPLYKLWIILLQVTAKPTQTRLRGINWLVELKSPQVELPSGVAWFRAQAMTKISGCWLCFLGLVPFQALWISVLSLRALRWLQIQAHPRNSANYNGRERSLSFSRNTS